MKHLRTLIINLDDDDLTQNLCRIFDYDKSISYKTIDLPNKTFSKNHLTKLLSNHQFDVLTVTVSPNSLQLFENIIVSNLFTKTGKPTIVFGENITDDKFSDYGLSDFVLAPFQTEEVLQKIRDCIQKDVFIENFLAKSKEKLGIQKIIGKNPAFISEINKLPLIAKCNVCVLITGETGTGKEIIARTIHYLSPRADKPFVPVNCGAIPNDLVENELFGHEKGAFTGAMFSHRGLITEASGGTLFLDEVDSLPLISQVKLLRFLQDKEYRSLGSVKTLKADVRIIAASNHNLDELVQAEKFRPDLFYRLNVMQVNLPPLRERIEDISLLCKHFLEKYSYEFQMETISIEPQALLKLQNYEWLGNVRELENVIERAILLSRGNSITSADLTFGTSKNETFSESFRAAKAKVINRFERNYLKRVLETYHGNISQAAKAAGKNRRAFFELIRKHRINVENFKT